MLRLLAVAAFLALVGDLTSSHEGSHPVGRTVAVFLALANGTDPGGERVALCVARDQSEHETTRDVDPDELLARLKVKLAAIRASQARVGLAVRELQRDYSPGYDSVYEREPVFPDSVLGERDPIVLQKGQKVIVWQTIAWRGYAEDDLLVWFRASDDSLRVPYNLQLNYERHQFRFEYEIKAGDKAGEFTVTLTPTPGKPVEVKVIVR